VEKLEDVSHDMKLLQDRLEHAEQNQNTEVISEMRVLQTLLNQVVERSSQSLSSQHDKHSRSAFSMPGGSEGDVLPEHNDEEILKIMHHALEDNRVDLYLQPIVSLPSRKTIYYEAFSRVRDEDDNVIFPTQYLKLAEDSGLVGTLDNLLLFRCIQVIRRLGPRKPDIRFFCNISSVSLNDKEFFPQFIDFMLDNQELAERLVFEFAQQDVVRMSPEIQRSLSNLGRRGFRFSMDRIIDPGLGLADLATRYFRYIKLGASFMLDGASEIHPEDMKEACSRYDIDLIIEKIEDEEMILEILDYEIDYGQGYLFGEPRLSSDAALGL